MKNLKLLALLFSMVVFISCGGDDEDDATPSSSVGGDGTMSATVSGTVSENVSASGDLFGAGPAVSATLTSGVLSIVGNDGGTTTSNQFNITIGQYTGPDTYDFGIANGNTATFTQTTTDLGPPLNIEIQAFTSISGSITVAEDGDTFNGTFSFTGQDNDENQVEVTNGKFNAGPNPNIR